MFEDKDERTEMETEGAPETGEGIGTEADGQVNFTMQASEQEDLEAQAREEQIRKAKAEAQARQEQARQAQMQEEQARQAQMQEEQIRRAQEQEEQVRRAQEQQMRYQQEQAQQRQYQQEQNRNMYSEEQQSGRSETVMSSRTDGSGADGDAFANSGAGGSGTGNGRNNKSRGGRRNRRDKNTKIRRPYAKAIGCSVLCGVIIGACVIGSFAIGRNMSSGNTANVVIATNEDRLAASDVTGDSAETAVATTTSTTSDGTEYTVAQIAEQCGSSVVAITNRSISEVQTMFGYYEYESEGSGSGVIIGLNDEELLIVTNYHVVEGASELTVCFFDSADAIYTAQIKGTDSNNDLAVVAVQVADIDEEVLGAISIATIGDSDSLQIGDGVVAIGNALGLGQSVTSGIVSAVDREVSIDGYVTNLIQTDAAINPGNSGGALFNMKGELVGINSAKYASEEIEGMGFAIPTSTAKPIIDQLMTQKTRVKLTEDYGYLNISGNDVSSQMVESYGMPEGVYVVQANEGGAAANAGIQTGDIITAMDGISTPNMDTLRERLQYYEAGENVEVTISRITENGYEERNVVVTLDNASDQEGFVSSSSDMDDGSADGSSGFYYDDDGDTYYWDGDISDFFGSFGYGR